MAVLPGIDANDESKTAAVFQLYTAVLSSVPALRGVEEQEEDQQAPGGNNQQQGAWCASPTAACCLYALICLSIYIVTSLYVDDLLVARMNAALSCVESIQLFIGL